MTKVRSEERPCPKPGDPGAQDECVRNDYDDSLSLNHSYQFEKDILTKLTRGKRKSDWSH